MSSHLTELPDAMSGIAMEPSFEGMKRSELKKVKSEGIDSICRKGRVSQDFAGRVRKTVRMIQQVVKSPEEKKDRSFVFVTPAIAGKIPQHFHL